MISSLFFTLLPVAPLPLPTPATIAIIVQDEDVETQIAACGDDVAKLWELGDGLKKNRKRKEARVVFKKIITIDAEHAKARKALGHHRYAEQWFETYTALSKFKRAEEKRMLEEEGKVRYGDGWAPQEDVPFLRMSWEKGEDGKYHSPFDIARVAEEAKLSEDGHQLRAEDSSWIHPDDFGKWTEGLFKCGEEWLDAPAANEYHNTLATMWTYTGAHFITKSPCNQETIRWADWYAEQAYPDMVRAYGIKPDGKPVFGVLPSVEMYNAVAVGDQEKGRPPFEQEGTSSCHYSFFAELWFEQVGDQPGQIKYTGGGICYWDRADATLAGFGQHAIRHAAAQSFAEGIDPSWNTVSQAISDPQSGAFTPQAFWGEKRIPRWFRYGVASYCERWFKDKTVAEGGNPWWAKDWAVANLKNAGGIRNLEAVFGFPIDVNDPDGSGKLIHESGAVLSFILDSNCIAVKNAHAGFKSALRKGEGAAEAAEALKKAVMDNAEALYKHLGIDPPSDEPAEAAPDEPAAGDGDAGGEGAGDGADGEQSDG